LGWWTVQGTSNTIGDLPLDTLEKAVASVLSDYQQAVGRAPTVAEWECLFGLVLAARDTERVFAEAGSIQRVEIQLGEPEPSAQR
jgi:hypothetical protein